MADCARWRNSGHDGGTSITVRHQKLANTLKKQPFSLRL
ncbi:Uncharacterised protein [Salmonella enterica subsp. indica]|uniref:Uncharacterized protein n=1 Tax=Salmonella enterica subsp. indica TaxID=59207 RepID=A0A379XVQ9_SALER|nr:Uncharacterised protein [Salmonella enterica subsp. indica]